MNDDTHDAGTSDFGTADPDGLVEAGLALVLRAEDYGDWKPVAEWLARHPEAARDVDSFLEVQKKLRPAAPGPLAPVPAGTVGGMERKGELGRGQFGVVYKALDPVLGREVAVKMVRDGTALSSVELARFRYEAKVVAQLDHPNIVRLHSYGETDGAPYLVMALMTGGSLAQRLKDLGPDRRLDQREAAEIVRDIALGIHHAHQRGLIHRDLKPANILLDGKGNPHVADFGLAREVNATTTANIAGTFAYMAPEQARGGQQLTTVVDVYALGVILFELLTGRVPYTGDVASILQQLTDPQVQPPPVRQFRPDANGDLEAICLKCLEKHRGARYASAKEVADELDAYLNGGAVKARAPGFWDWLGQLARTRPEPHPHYSWEVLVWNGIILVVTNVAVYAMARYHWPSAGIWVAQGAASAALAVVLWWHMLRRFRQLPVTERHSLIIAVGMIAVYLPLMVAYVPFSLSTPAREGLKFYPPLAALSGLAFIVLGSTNWSRFFPIGLAVMALVPVLTWWPDEAPLIYGVSLAALLWYWAWAKHDGFGYKPPAPDNPPAG